MLKNRQTTSKSAPMQINSRMKIEIVYHRPPNAVGDDFDDLGDPENARIYRDRLLSPILLHHALSGQKPSARPCSEKCLRSCPLADELCLERCIAPGASPTAVGRRSRALRQTHIRFDDRHHKNCACLLRINLEQLNSIHQVILYNGQHAGSHSTGRVDA